MKKINSFHEPVLKLRNVFIFQYCKAPILVPSESALQIFLGKGVLQQNMQQSYRRKPMSKYESHFGMGVLL